MYNYLSLVSLSHLLIFQIVSTLKIVLTISKSELQEEKTDYFKARHLRNGFGFRINNKDTVTILPCLLKKFNIAIIPRSA